MSAGKGFWLNSRTDKFFEVIDHALALQSKDVKKYGLPSTAVKRIGEIVKKKLTPDEKRKRLLLAAMDKGFIRVRQRKAMTTLEFTAPISKALPAIFTFMNTSKLHQHQSNLRLTNLKENVMVDISWKEFKNKIESGKYLNKETAEIFSENIIQFPDLTDMKEGKYVPSR